MYPNQSFPCIFCDGSPGHCTPGCPSPMSFDPRPVMDALGLHLHLDAESDQ